MFQESSSSSQRKTSKSQEPALPDWLAFLTPKKEPPSLAEDDPFGLKPKGVVLFPPGKKMPTIISGNHLRGNLTTIDENQDLLKDVSPVKFIRPETAVSQAATKSDPVKKVPVALISLSPSKWLILVLLLLSGTLVMVSQYFGELSQPESSSPLPSPPLTLKAPPPAPAPTAKTTIGIPKRIVNIIKQELSPFELKDASVESSNPATLSFNSNPTATIPSVNLTETTMGIVHKTLKKIQQIVKALLSKITSYAKELHFQMQGVAKKVQSIVESSSMLETEDPLSPETRQQCDHLWKWILNRSCRLERKQSQTSGSKAVMLHVVSEEESQCQNLLSRECRQQKRAMFSESSLAASTSHGSAGQVPTRTTKESQKGTPVAAAAAHKKSSSARDTRYSTIVLKAFGSGGKFSGVTHVPGKTK